MQLTAMFHSIFSHDLSRLIISRDSVCLAKNEDTSDGWKSFDAAFFGLLTAIRISWDY